VEARVDRNAALLAALGRGDLDLAVTWNEGADAVRCREELGRLPIVWIGQPGFRRDGSQPVPLVLFEQPCIFSRQALAALDGAGIAWRLAFTSPSLSSLWAAVSAGLGIAVRTPEGLPSGLTALNAKRADLPALKEIGLHLCTSEGAAASPPVTRLQALLRERLQASLTSRPKAGGRVARSP
jgi:DNA-binding transcriptional LysR family regulator